MSITLRRRRPPTVVTPPAGRVPTRRPRPRSYLLLAAVVTLLAGPAAGQQIDPNVPVRIDEQDLANLPLFVDRVLDNTLNGTGAANEMLVVGNRMVRSVAAIIVVLTGLQIAFSGNFQPWQIFRLVLTLGFPIAMLQWYATPIPGVGLSFPAMVAGGGDWIAELFAADIFSLIISELTLMMSGQLTRLELNWSEFSLWDLLRGGAQLAYVAASSTLILWAFMLGMIVVIALALAQVLFAKVALAILVAIGPLLIPFMVVPKMDFLFWGWFKALIQYSLYSAIAVIMLRVWSAIILGYTTTFANTPFTFQAGIWTGLWAVAMIAVIVCAIVSILKIGDIAGMIVGAGSDGGGFVGGVFLASRVMTAPVRAIAPVAKGAGVPGV